MKAIILAAGRGSRMMKLTRDKPKCLVEVHGVPLLELQLEALLSAGIEKKNIAIVGGYKYESLKKYELKEFYNHRWEQTNMVSSLECAHSWLEKETCIVSYSDIFYHSSAIKQLMDNSSSMAITYDVNWQLLWEKRFDDPLTDAETFCLGNNNRLTEIGNRPDTLEQVQGQYMGLIRFQPDAWREVNVIRSNMMISDCDKLDMTGLLQKIIARQIIPITAIAYNEAWGEVDSLEDLNVYEQDLMEWPYASI